jgi:hypothetical protein
VSLRPVEYPQLLQLPYHEQIAAQIYYVMKDIQSSLANLESGRSLYVRYEDVCKQPKVEVQRVVTLLEQQGCAVDWISDCLPDHFPSTNVQRIDDNEFRLLQDACCKLL